MAKINRIEDLDAWQEARKLCQGIYLITNHFPKYELYNIMKHLRENGRGVPANIAEGFGRYFFKEKLRFYGIAKGCLEEMRNDIYLSYDSKYINKEIFNKFINQINKVCKQINGLISITLQFMKKH
ncbi:MAG: four helix bundle protein [Patescibacteria group bacterium]|jgi:four helix bundle protein